MPRYDVRCQFCNGIHETRMPYAEYDLCRSTATFRDRCPTCEQATSHVFVVTRAPAVEYACDGFTGFDDADAQTKYQRNHFSRSGDNNDKRLWERKRRRPELAREG